MTNVAKVFGAYSLVAFRVQRRYTIAMWAIAVGVIIEPLLYLLVWKAATGENGAGGYSAKELSAYFLLMLIANHFSYTWFFGTMDRRVRTGQISNSLLLPVHPFYADVADNLSFKAITGFLVVPLAVALLLFADVELSPSPMQALAGTVALAVGAALRITVEWWLSLASFWTTRVDGIGQVYGAVSHFLGGFVAPLSTLPVVMQNVAEVSPFRWFAAFPVEALLGHVDTMSIIGGILVQLSLLALAVLALAVTWRAGLRRLSVVGG